MSVERLAYALFVIELNSLITPFYIPAVVLGMAMAGYTYIFRPQWCSLGAIGPGDVGRSMPWFVKPRAMALLIGTCEFLIGLPVAVDWLVRLVAAVVSDSTAVRIADGYMGLDPTWYVQRTAAQRVEDVLGQVLLLGMAVAAVMMVRGWARHSLDPNCRAPTRPRWLMVICVIVWLLITRLRPDALTPLVALLESTLPLYLLSDGVARASRAQRHSG